jgi:hypothetical protein
MLNGNRNPARLHPPAGSCFSMLEKWRVGLGVAHAILLSYTLSANQAAYLTRFLALSIVRLDLSLFRRASRVGSRTGSPPIQILRSPQKHMLGKSYFGRTISKRSRVRQYQCGLAWAKPDDRRISSKCVEETKRCGVQLPVAAKRSHPRGRSRRDK